MLRRTTESSPRRLETPVRSSARRSEVAQRSCSRRGDGGSARCQQSRSRLRHRSSTPEEDRLRERQRELHNERERLRRMEDELSQKRIQLHSTDGRTGERNRPCSLDAPPLSRRSSRNREEVQRHPVTTGTAEGSPSRSKRSRSPTFTPNDVVHNILNAIKDSRSRPSTNVAPILTNSVNHKNILPNFDPSSKNQRIDIWLKKVNECATVYGWDEKTTIHFAMQKLQGLAKSWYESLNSILFTWVEWQQKLVNVFPYEQNYGQSLEEMLQRRSKYSEPIELYYYDKLALLNQCDIEGKRAVDCIIHGLGDKSLKSSALALRCTHPDQLLQFLISNKETSQFLDRPIYNKPGSNVHSVPSNFNNNSGNSQNDKIFCFNCKEYGHPFLRCQKPLIKCSLCFRVGHKEEQCKIKGENQSDREGQIKKTMCITSSSPSSKFCKDFLG